MTNDYFNHDDPLDSFALARATTINAIFTAIAAGFELLPSEAELSEVRPMETVTGTANALVYTSSGTAIASYTAGLLLKIKIATTNTTTVTINVDGLGAVAVKQWDGTALAAGDLVAGRIYLIIYDGTAFQLIGTTAAEIAAQVTAAAASASSASTSATNAATSATNAATAETNAETAETNAETAEVAAEAAQAAAEAAQAAAEAAVSSIGWTLIETVATTSGASVDIDNIPSTWQDLMLVFNNVSPDGSANITLAISPDSSSYSGTLTLSAALAAAGQASHHLYIPRCQGNSGFITGFLRDTALSASPSLVSTTALMWPWACTGGIEAFRISVSAGAFDAGSVSLYGRK